MPNERRYSNELNLESVGINLPYNMQAEQSVLGAVLLKPDTLTDLVEILKPEMFYTRQNAQIWTEMLRLFTNDQTIDFVTLLDAVVSDGVFPSADEAKIYLTGLAETVPSISNVKAYAQIVQEKYLVRQLMGVAKDILQDAGDEPDADLLLENAEQRIYEIRSGRDSSALTPLSSSMVETLTNLQKISGPDADKYKGIPTGFRLLDTVLTGLGRGDLIILAARPGMGKTSFALNIATRVAMQQKAVGEVNGYIEEMMEGQKVVKVFCHEEESKADFDRLNEKLFYESQKANRYANILMPILNNIGNVLYVIVAVAGGILLVLDVPNMSVSGMAVSISIIVPFLNMTKQFAGNINQVSNQVNAVVMGMAGTERIFNLMDEQPEQDNGYVTLVNAKEENGVLTECSERTGLWAWKHPHTAEGTVTYTKLTGDVRLFDVDFAYTEGKTVLKNVSIYAKPGQKVAFVGATGAGKTTITNLLNRFYDIADGKIRYDGININKIKKADLRRSLGIVLQETNLFTGTVMENIRYGKLDATDEECIAAAKLAGADDFITRLPDGYQTYLSGNGANLSQGQRQLLSIARAAAADPPVMILDEATSSIDTRTEAIVQKGMDALMEGRTVFVIAHRLSTVKNSDVIIVLDHGNIIERGNHDALIAMKGQYYQLYTGAFELE